MSDSACDDSQGDQINLHAFPSAHQFSLESAYVTGRDSVTNITNVFNYSAQQLGSPSSLPNPWGDDDSIHVPVPRPWSKPGRGRHPTTSSLPSLRQNRPKGHMGGKFSTGSLPTQPSEYFARRPECPSLEGNSVAYTPAARASTPCKDPPSPESFRGATMDRIITQTMIGEFLYKYTRKKIGRGHTQTRHRRFFWIHPYTKTVSWSPTDPVRADSGSGASFKSAFIEDVRAVVDLNNSPPGLYQYSMIISLPNRELKVTAPTKLKHDLWLSALRYVLVTPPMAIMPSLPSARRHQMLPDPSRRSCVSPISPINIPSHPQSPSISFQLSGQTAGGTADQTPYDDGGYESDENADEPHGAHSFEAHDDNASGSSCHHPHHAPHTPALPSGGSMQVKGRSQVLHYHWHHHHGTRRSRVRRSTLSVTTKRGESVSSFRTKAESVRSQVAV